MPEMITPPIEEMPIDTHELLRQIETRDNRFRAALAIFVLLILLGLVALLVNGYRLQSDNHKLIETQNSLTVQQQKQTNELERANNMKLNDLQNHIDCIVALFATPNRTSFFISDITNCKINAVPTPSPQASAPTTQPSVSKSVVFDTPQNTNQPRPAASTPTTSEQTQTL